jgi:HAD superfamily hydrolase (TIGR01509 family)
MTIKAIIFDLDGVLVASRQLHYETFAAALRQLKGMELSWRDHEVEYDGLSTRRKLALMVERGLIGTDDVEALFDLKQELTKERLGDFVAPSAQKRALLIELKRRGIRLACASNAIRWSLDESLRLLGIRDLFEVILSNEDVAQPKPSPEIYVKTMAVLGVGPKNTLIVEDSPHGLTAARASGANVLQTVDPMDTTIEKIYAWLKSRPVIHVVVPMAGAGSRFAVAGFTKPKPFIDVMGKPMIFWVIDNMLSSKYNLKFHFIMRTEHVGAYGFEAQLAAAGIDATFHPVAKITEGAACSVLLAKDHINNDEPFVMINSDQYLDINIDDFYDALLNPAFNGVISTFWQPDQTDLKWSYAALDAEGLVVDVREKQWIGPNATTGLYGWRRGADFVRYAEQMIAKNIRVNGEFYAAPVYNEAIADGAKVRTQLCKTMYGLGVPADLEYFIANYKKSLKTPSSA